MRSDFRVLLALFRHTHPFGYFKGVYRYAALREDWQLDSIYHDDAALQFQDIQERPADGLIVCCNRSIPQDLEYLRQYRGPVVSVTPDTPMDVAPHVASNLPHAYEQMAEHFHSLGRSHVAYLGLDNRPPSHAAAGLLQDYCAARGIPFSAFLRKTTPENELLIPPRQVDDILPEIRDWMQQLPAGTGILCRTDSDGCTLIRAAKLLGRAVPEELAIAGIGDFLIASTSQPQLTSFELPLEEVGFQAAALLDRMMRGEPRPTEPTIVDGGKLIARGSTLQHPDDIHRALITIRDESTLGLTVKELCWKLGVSRVTLERRFRASVGYTPGEAIRLGRLDAAKKLLEGTDLTVEQICLRSGFESPSSFSKFFRERTGHSPGQYRDLQNGDKG